MDRIVFVAGWQIGIQVPVRRNQCGNFYFRKTIRMADGTKRRLDGTPGIGRYQQFPATKVGAQQAEQFAIAEALRGPAQPQPKAAKESVTFADYADTFLKTYGPDHKPSQRRSTKYIVKAKIVPTFGPKRLDELTQSDVDAWVASLRKQKLAVKTVNNLLGCLSSLIKYAVKNGLIAPYMPALECKIGGMAGEIEAVPMDDVEKLLKAAEDDRYRVAVLLAVEAGLRTGEIRGLQWGDLKGGLLTVRRSIDKDSAAVIAPKHNKGRVIPLSSRLAAALEGLPRKGLWVLTREDGGPLVYNTLVKETSALYERAEVERPRMPLHALRHTFGTTMAGRGTPLPVLQALMGHADIRTTMRYVDVNEAQKRSAIAAVFGPSAVAENGRNAEGSEALSSK